MALAEGSNLKDRYDLIKELEVMKTIGSHPNVIGFVGCCTQDGQYDDVIDDVK